MNSNLEFIEKKAICADIWQLHFKKPASFDYVSGQYIEMTIASTHPDERGIKRWFTLSSSPTQPDIIITTRLVSPKHSVFKADLFKLSSGENVGVEGPDGKFVLPAKDQKLLWIAGGIGVTPYISQLQYLLDNKQLERDIVLVLGLRSLDEDPCVELVKKCLLVMPNFKIIRVISENIPANWTGPTGYITQELLTDTVEDILDRQVYVSGPEPMVDAMKDTLLKTGLAESHIHQDWFAGYKDKY